jgi:hypothetical protein
LLPEKKTVGVRKLVYVKGFGEGDSTAAIYIFERLPFKALFENAYNDKTVQKPLIAANDLDWLIGRPGVQTNFTVLPINAGQFNSEKPMLIRYPL